MTFPADDVTSARHVRMLTTLLAACDPCGWVDEGGSPNLYAGLALATLKLLQVGADAPTLLTVLPSDTETPAAMQFTRAAVDWWTEARPVRDALLAALLTA